MQEGQHPLAIINSPSLLSVEEDDVRKCSPNNRRRRRGSRRRSSAVGSSTDVVNENALLPPRRKSSTFPTKEKESPALHSLVDMIREMKRLPSISITTDKQAVGIPQPTTAVKSNNNDWTRVRRHSEPHHKLKQHMEHNKPPLRAIHEQQQQQQKKEKPVFSNAFLVLENEGDVNNFENPVSPPSIHPGRRLTPPRTKRNRSQSVPSNSVPFSPPPPPPQHQHQERRPLYPAHLPVCEASAAVRAHTLFSGILRVDVQDSSEANVECEELDGHIYIFGSRNRNRALDGDEVAVELVDVDEMLNEKQSKRQARHTRRMSSMSLGVGSPSSHHLSSIPESDSPFEDFENNKPRPKYCGRVVSILERPKNMLFSGTLSLNRPHAKTLDNGSREKKDPHSPKIIWFIPADKRLPLAAVPIKHAPSNFIKYHEEYKNRIFVGNIQRWPATSLHPFGLIEKEIGYIGELGVHSGALMADHHIKDVEFSEATLKATAEVPLGLTESDKQGRRDLTKENITVFTVGDTQRQMDYAFSFSDAEKGVFEVGIHVTDVAHFIRENTSLDREARERSCAVSLVDKEIPILPVDFTESHCSLGVSDKQQRLAFSVLCRFTENGVLLHAWVGKTVIQTTGHVNLSHLLNDDEEEDEEERPLEKDAKSIFKICRKLQLNRLRHLEGASLAKSVQKFTLGESGYPEEVERVHQTDRDVLLQELLIIANIEVGQKIASRFPDQALLYRQDVPKLSKLTAVQDYFENGPLTGSIQGLLKLIKENEPSVEKQDTLLHVIRQCTPPSKYFSAGSLDISKYRHAGFAAAMCTLFTEPIHNYASIHAQRQLASALVGEEQKSENFDAIDKIARHCNSALLAKLSAEQESKKLYTAAYIYRQCLDTETKKMTVEAYTVHFDVDVLHLYIPEFDIEIPVTLDESLQHKEDITQFMSRVDIRIHVDMKTVRPVLDIEIIHE